MKQKKLTSQIRLRDGQRNVDIQQINRCCEKLLFNRGINDRCSILVTKREHLIALSGYVDSMQTKMDLFDLISDFDNVGWIADYLRISNPVQNLDQWKELRENQRV